MKCTYKQKNNYFIQFLHVVAELKSSESFEFWWCITCQKPPCVKNPVDHVRELETGSPQDGIFSDLMVRFGSPYPRTRAKLLEGWLPNDQVAPFQLLSGLLSGLNGRSLRHSLDQWLVSLCLPINEQSASIPIIPQTVQGSPHPMQLSLRSYSIIRRLPSDAELALTLLEHHYRFQVLSQSYGIMLRDTAWITYSPHSPKKRQRRK